MWCVVFTEYWKHQEVDLAVRWGVRGVSKIEKHRRDFKHEKEITDPVTGERVRMFPATKRFQRQLLQVPFALATALVLGTLIGTCFGIEIFISEIYHGPLQWALVCYALVYSFDFLTRSGIPAYGYPHHRHANPHKRAHQLCYSTDAF